MIVDPLQFFVLVFRESVENYLGVDRSFYGTLQMLPGLSPSGGEDEHLGHRGYSVYLAALPLTRSAGYFCPFNSTFALAASTGSIPSFAASSVR